MKSDVKMRWDKTSKIMFVCLCIWFFISLILVPGPLNELSRAPNTLWVSGWPINYFVLALFYWIFVAISAIYLVKTKCIQPEEEDKLFGE
jgi:putative solute:sodium symporter small subunit